MSLLALHLQHDGWDSLQEARSDPGGQKKDGSFGGWCRILQHPHKHRRGGHRVRVHTQPRSAFHHIFHLPEQGQSQVLPDQPLPRCYSYQATISTWFLKCSGCLSHRCDNQKLFTSSQANTTQGNTRNPLAAGVPVHKRREEAV